MSDRDEAGILWRLIGKVFGRESAPTDWRAGTPGTYLSVTGAVSVIGVVVLALYGAFGDADGWAVSSLSVLVSAGSFFLAGLIGYLFGIPRSATQPETSADTSYVDNDNLVDVSDWLTKIIIGAGLIEIRQLVDFVNGLGTSVADEVPNLSGGTAIFTSLIVFQGAAGFLFFYLWSRVYMPHLFQLSKARAQVQREEIELRRLETERQQRHIEDEVLYEEFRRAEARGVQDANLDLWLGVLANDTERVQSAIAAGADVNMTSRQLFERLREP